MDLLDEAALARILTEPKNALIKQYQKLFELDGVKLEFDSEALLTIARQSFERKTGARGLRAIMERAMTDVMYEIPSDENIGTCKITKEVVEGTGQPELSYRSLVVPALDGKKKASKADASA